jgi:membrane-bound inhibitor of C-type lysozyme
MMEEGADPILNIIVPLRKVSNINFFILVDQFEELFRFAFDQNDISKKDEATNFVKIIMELAQQNVVPFYVVITMRADFIGDCAQFIGLPEAMNKSLFLVPRLNRVQLKMVIEGPAKLYGGKLNPSLTSRLLNELDKVKDELPVLQHALMRIWDHEIFKDKNGELDLEDYKSIGGLEKALSIHADEALTGMSMEQKTMTKKLFQALTTIDENGRKIRRPVLFSQLEKLTLGTEGQLLNIIDHFIKDKRSFLTINKAANSKEKVIDISHESLIRQWDTLSNWVDEEGESASMYLHLIEATNLQKQDKKDFLIGSELQLALEWRDKFKPSAIWADLYKKGFEECMAYLKASEDERTHIYNVEKVRKKNRRYLVIAVIGLLLIVATDGIYSLLHEAKKKQDKLEKEKQNELDSINEALQVALIQKGKADSALIIAETLIVAGAKYQGGIVIYWNKTGKQGLLAAEKEFDKLNWRDAKKACENYSVIVEGIVYDDWRLPTKEELNALYINKNVVGGFAVAYYWSSSQSNNSTAWLQYFGSGSQSLSKNDYRCRVRAVRAF